MVGQGSESMSDHLESFAVVALDDRIGKHRDGLPMPNAFLPLDLAELAMCACGTGDILNDPKGRAKIDGLQLPLIADLQNRAPALPSKLQYPAIGPRIDHRGLVHDNDSAVGNHRYPAFLKDAGSGRIHASEAGLRFEPLSSSLRQREAHDFSPGEFTQYANNALNRGLADAG